MPIVRRASSAAERSAGRAPVCIGAAVAVDDNDDPRPGIEDPGLSSRRFLLFDAFFVVVGPG